MATRSMATHDGRRRMRWMSTNHLLMQNPADTKDYNVCRGPNQFHPAVTASSSHLGYRRPFFLPDSIDLFLHSFSSDRTTSSSSHPSVSSMIDHGQNVDLPHPRPRAGAISPALQWE
ncbi:uncharacterized protein AMSG_12159 [Thecamonas trahens ATCC 50062]|uniref:Uncharacterized protein n=1 Tax=Thecamonas trahens ATCC 50062 TaxID=461836 RepID=A0A0L0DJV5_THETB|nr:hypothetical protein AMSG_12159 [Thecamonas trahens ATCC 50062]KNC52381.1 hypothetical protein AMSG_12159 [Thecamonas trahens ATCC 50062]|eukprot:XP_013755499.1 hypothetical protein AMSG_12159 [Thecamonas trahens ATCC 50062]